ncbi:MAG: hypothetical protein V7K32_16230 [Nostoc sp.]
MTKSAVVGTETVPKTLGDLDLGIKMRCLIEALYLNPHHLLIFGSDRI